MDAAANCSSGLVWFANVYMSFFGRLRLEIREDRLAIAAAESQEGNP